MAQTPAAISATGASAAALSPDEQVASGFTAFEARILRESERFELTCAKPDAVEREVMEKLRSGGYVTDTAIAAMIGAWSVYDSPRIGFAGIKGADGLLYPDARRVIAEVMPYAYGRPDLSVMLHEGIGQFANANSGANRDAATVQRAYAAALSEQKPLYLAAWERYDALCVEQGDLLLQAGKADEATDMYARVLQDDTYYFFHDSAADSSAARRLTDIAVSAGRGLVNCRRGNLAALQGTFFSRTISPLLNPIRDQAIRDAGGTPAKPTPLAPK